MAPERTPQLHVNLTNKILSLNGIRRLRLDGSLFGAEVARVLNTENEYLLTLKYGGKIGDIDEEGSRVYQFLDKMSHLRNKSKIQVYSTPMQPEIESPSVSLVGEMMARVCS
tara:strand:+ start:1915 stop:2250 length:336 start_codon:yes stop_codon:yes gene_type:complete